MLKKIVVSTIALIMTIGLIIPTAIHANEVGVTINGTPVNFVGQGPVIVDGRTLVPVRAVFEALGFNVAWNQTTQTATMTRGGDTIVITIGSATFTTNGVARTLDVPAQIINNSTLVPIRLPLESVGYAVGWDGANNRVTVHGRIVVTEQTNRIDISSSLNMEIRGSHYVRTGQEFELLNFIEHDTGLWLSGLLDLASDNPSAISVVPQDVQISIFRLNQPGTAAITFRHHDGSWRNGQATLTVTAVTRTLFEADQKGINIPSRVLLSQSDIQRLLPFARTSQETRSQTTHPNRPMTQGELQAWIQEYNSRGGINAFELEVLYLVNEIRAEHGLHPYILCPYLSMAARLATQLHADGHTLVNHVDPIYGTPYARVLLFAQATDTIGENLAPRSSTPSSVVSGWMNSPGHRRSILSEGNTFIGIGNTDSTWVQKFQR